MQKRFVLVLTALASFLVASAQEQDNSVDTFFLAKKKGLLGRLGKSVATRSPSTAPPVKSADPFKKYNGKIIRYIETVPVGFNQNLNDTAEIRRSLAVRIANRLHRNTRNSTVRKNLFFKEGDAFLPLLISDNERFLRDLPYIRDAAIVVYKSVMSDDSVDIIVLTRDIFSIGGNFSASNLDRLKSGIREENLAGNGTRFGVNFLYDKSRNPRTAFGAELVQRNVRGSFLNASIGFKQFRNAIVTDRKEESTYYLNVEKPLINRYTQWTGAFSISHNETSNAYIEESWYKFTSEYRYNNIDLWGGYNIGWGKGRRTDSEKRLRHFVAGRAFYNYFDEVPGKYKDSFSANYTNLNGVLFSYELYKQNFYLTNFIYGFGRNEDVPIGLNASVTAGWTNTQDRLRGYYGASFEASSYSKKGFFSAYTGQLGAYKGKGNFEDVSLLLNVDHFTRLRKLSKQWFNRNFFSVSYTRIFNRTLVRPLVLQSNYGLPYIRLDSLNYFEAVSRATFKLESVYFNLRKFFGFRFAPFVFTEFSFLKPLVNPENKTIAYSAIGGGIRTRNENLVLGTIELRAYYFPRLTPTEMNQWKIKFTSNLRYKYTASLVSRPELAGVN